MLLNSRMGITDINYSYRFMFEPYVFFQPMHENFDLRQEQLNKASLLYSKAFLEDLLGLFNTHVVRFFIYFHSRYCNVFYY